MSDKDYRVNNRKNEWLGTLRVRGDTLEAAPGGNPYFRNVLVKLLDDRKSISFWVESKPVYRRLDGDNEDKLRSILDYIKHNLRLCIIECAADTIPVPSPATEERISVSTAGLYYFNSTTRELKAPSLSLERLIEYRQLLKTSATRLDANYVQRIIRKLTGGLRKPRAIGARAPTSQSVQVVQITSKSKEKHRDPIDVHSDDRPFLEIIYRQASAA